MTPTAPTPATSTATASTPTVQASSVAGPVSRPLPRPFAGDLDWPLVAALRQQASDRLSASLGQERTRLTAAEQRTSGRVDHRRAAAGRDRGTDQRRGADLDAGGGGRDGRRGRGRPVRAGPAPAAGG